jgi:hypothetical protein
MNAGSAAPFFGRSIPKVFVSPQLGGEKIFIHVHSFSAVSFYSIRISEIND